MYNPFVLYRVRHVSKSDVREVELPRVAVRFLTAEIYLHSTALHVQSVRRHSIALMVIAGVGSDL